MSRGNILNALSEFISIQTVSADPKRHDQILKAAYLLARKLKEINFNVEILKKGKASPLIIASKFVSTESKTIGVYAHYDVQPEDPVDEWKTPPFKLTLRGGKFFGRGIADDKGHLMQILVSLYRHVKSGSLKNNIVFIFEGEEEIGSKHFEEYVSRAKKLLSRIDVFYLIDVGMHKKNIPQIFYALRGLVYFDLQVEIGERDLHSGIYGNVVLDPTFVISSLFCKIKDVRSGKILIPHFYDQVKKNDLDELNLLEKTKVEDRDLEKEAQVYRVLEIEGNASHLSPKIFPSFDIHGFISGYTGEGTKTVIPRMTKVKFSFRLVENQDPNKIEKLVTSFIKNNLPKGVRYELKTLAKFYPFYTDVNNNFVRNTASILEQVFKNKTLLNRAGGSVPAAEILQRIFEKPIILTGFTLPDEKAHSPNENFDEEMFFKGIEVLKKIYSQ